MSDVLARANEHSSVVSSGAGWEVAGIGVYEIYSKGTRSEDPHDDFRGIAHAKGIKITIPEQSALLRADHVYGLEDIRFGDPMEERYKQKEKDYRAKIEELKSQIFTLEGAAHECKEFYTAMAAKRRGLWAK